MAGFDLGAVFQQQIERAVKAALRNSVFMIDDDLVPQMVESLYSATSETAATVIDFITLVDRGLADIGTRLEGAHTEIAKGAQQATVDAYMLARAAGRQSPAYRLDPIHSQNQRYAGGLLQGALQSAGFAVGTSTGIQFANVALMNAAAKQWARLNFGAGAAAEEGGVARTFTVGWSNLDIAAIGVQGEPRPAFRIPGGYWFGQEFYPMSEVPTSGGMGPIGATGGIRQEPRMTRGIRAEHWLDAGTAFIAESLPRTYRNIYVEIFNEAKTGAVSTGRVPMHAPTRPPAAHVYTT